MSPRGWTRLAGCTALLAALACPPARAQQYPVIAAAEARVHRDSLDALNHYELGMARLLARRFAPAESSLRTAVRLDPRCAVAWLALAVVRDQDRDYWQRLHRGPSGDSLVVDQVRTRSSYYRRAFLLDPLVDLAPLAMGDPRGLGMSLGSGLEAAYLRVDSVWGGYHIMAGSADSMPPGLLWSHGMLAARTNRLPMAAIDFTALLNAMRIIEERGNPRLLPLDANEVRYALAAVHQLAGNNLQAITLYREVIENDIGNYVALGRLASAYEAQQQWAEALRARRAAITTNPEDKTLQIDLAETLFRAGQAARAESLLVYLAPDLMGSPRLFFVLGQVQWALNERPEARETFTTFLSLAPERWVDQRRLANERISGP